MKTPDAVLEQITQQIGQLLKQSPIAQADIQQNLKSLIQSQLSKLDVVSREEFEIQQAMLEKARTQIEQLSQQLEAMEKSLNSSESNK